MTSRTEIAAKLDDFAFQKINFGGFLMNKRAKNSHALWTRSSDKGVTELAILATRDYGDGNVYDVAAFTTDGTVPSDVIADIAPQAEALADAINLREHGYVYSSLEPWDGGGTIWISKKPQFRALGRPDEGIHVIPIQRLSGINEPRWLAWARENGQLHIAIVYKP
ncbi:hypothetical protein [Microbacterium sp. Leaf159]|uniref:hypothetical protein n=1 Tax=Microbacterium sp. Leaf159 TaxID=1736279 RepID=UPI0006FEF058|nr:hypothetical protein [Microbacterium sp. Leaf159]KQR38575.1 hypothetical protein ASF80_03490 [Microbacterium sp. Leaf159]